MAGFVEPVRGLNGAVGDGDLHDDLIHDAKAATDEEKGMTLMQGIRLYPKAILWSVLISTCIVMEGYDLCLLGNFYAFPQFNRKFGHPVGNGTYQVSAPWQAGLSNVR